MRKVVQFEVLGKEYVAYFDWGFINPESYVDESVHYRDITTCTLITLPERYVLSGAAMLHPKDTEKASEGERIAFRRAVLAYLLLIDKASGYNRNIEQHKATIKLYQKAMGAEKYKIYGKEE